MIRGSRTARRAASLLLAIVACAFVLPVGAQKSAKTKTSYTGQAGLFIPTRTDAGTWDGTWYYNSIGAKIAVWMRTRHGRTEARVKYESLQFPLAFETDWKGVSSYYNAEQPASFDMKLTRTTPADLDGTWKWDTRLVSSSRSETGKFTMYRALDGRTLVMEFTEYELLVIAPKKTVRSTQPPIWTFIKASKREALWDELPF